VVQRVHPPLLRHDGYEDVQLEILESHGPAMWSAVVLVSPSLEPGRVAMLQLGPEHSAFALRGRRLRLLGVRVISVDSVEPETPEPLITPSAWTETFVCEAPETPPKK
jgi:hypothetical protein